MRKFYIYESDKTWFCPIQEDVERVGLSEDIDAGRTPSFQTIPCVSTFTYENEFLLERFLPENVPWSEFGMVRVSDGWKTHVIDRPLDTESWVRTTLKSRGFDYISHVYGEKSKKVGYYSNVPGHISTHDTSYYTNASGYAHEVLPDFLDRWEPENARVYQELMGLAPERAVDFPVLYQCPTLCRAQALADFEIYLGTQLLPCLRAGYGIAVTAKLPSGEVVGFAGGTLMPMPKCYQTNSTREMAANLELVMSKQRPDLRGLSIVPNLFIRFVDCAFSMEYPPVGVVDIAANWDASVDKYKEAFTDRTIPIPGLRWSGDVTR